MTTVQRLLAAAALPMCVALPGCALSGGAVYHRTADTSPDGNGIGGRVTGITKFGRDEGIALGGDGEVGWRPGKSPVLSPELGKIHVLAGWASSPLPYRSSAVGVDLLATAGLGHQAYDDRVVHAFSFGPRIGVPIRLVRKTQLWDSEEKIGATPMLVPTLEWNWFMPIDRGESRALRSDFAVGIAFRVHLWSALRP